MTPYKWRFDKKKGYVFLTENGFEYEVKIVEIGGIYFNNYPEIQSISYEFCFNAKNTEKIKYDERVSLTIVDITKALLRKGKIIMFVCDSIDKRQKSRHLLFQQWFKKYGNLFAKHDIELTDDEQTYYLSLLFDPKQNNSVLIEKAFQESINEYISYKT